MPVLGCCKFTKLGWYPGVPLCFSEDTRHYDQKIGHGDGDLPTFA